MKVVIGALFDERTANVVRSYAKEKGTPCAELVRRGVLSEIKRHDRDGRWKRALAGVKDFVWPGC